MTKPVNTKTHTDIKRLDWIERKLPAKIRPYAYLARLDRPIGIWLLLLPGWWSIILASGGFWDMNSHEWLLMVLFGIGAIVMRAAGCVINDLWDRDLDKQVERTKSRPLASGDISVKQAIVFLAGLLTTGLIILLQMNLSTIILGIVTIPLIITYPYMKRLTWWPQAFLGITFNFGVLMGWAAVTGTVSISCLILYAAAICWTIGYDTIYAQQDKEDDALAGMKSTALLFGEQSPIWVKKFYEGTTVLLFFATLLATGSLFSAFCVLLATSHLLWQITDWNPEDHTSSLAIFKSNRDFALLVALALGIGT